MDIQIFERLGLALAIGLLVGIERGWQEREGPDGSRTAGIRTFSLIGLLGGTMGALTTFAGPWPLAVTGLVLTLAFGAFQWREGAAENDFSVTSVVACLLTYVLGAYAVVGSPAAAAAAGVAAAALLAARETLHQFLRRLTWAELRSALLLLAMTFLLLPVLPREPIDPWGVLVPYELWLLVILIGAVSFTGYVAVRLMGDKQGLAVAAAAGALVSSTAVTLSNARLAALRPSSHSSLAGATCIAWAVSLLRVAAVACAVNWRLLLPLGVPLFVAACTLGASSFFFYRHHAEIAEGDRLKLQNPFELSTVLFFGATLALVLPLARLASDYLGAVGLFGLAALTGLVDVDPIVLSTARLANGSIELSNASLAILIAAGANIVGKSIIAASAGGLKFAWPLAAAGAAAFLSSGVTVLAVSTFLR